MKAIFNLRTRFVAIFALLLMALSVVSGMTPQLQAAGMGGLVTASYASGSGSGGSGGGGGGGGGTKGPNNLWDTVDKSSVGNGGLTGGSTNLGTVVDKSKAIAKTVTSILTIISFTCLLFWVAKLAMSAGNPQSRKIALTGILFAGIALALFGGSWIVVSFFWNVLN